MPRPERYWGVKQNIQPSKCEDLIGSTQQFVQFGQEYLANRKVHQELYKMEGFQGRNRVGTREIIRKGKLRVALGSPLPRGGR